MKKCNSCLTEKELFLFYKDKSRADGFTGTCKECSKKRATEWAKNNKSRINKRNNEWQKKNKHKVYGYNLKSDYGFTIEEYDQMYDLQKGKCVICGDYHKKRELVVDHSHQSGRVRGLLCKNCNKGIGLLEDNPALAHRAGDYLLGVV